MSASISYDELPMDWVGDWIRTWVRRSPQRTAVFDAGSGQRYTYGELAGRAERLGTWLLDEVGLAPGDKVCLLCRNRIEALDLYLACGRAGLILAPLSYRLRPRELNDLLHRIAPGALIHEEVFNDLVGQLERPSSLLRIEVLTDSGEEFERLLAPCVTREIDRPVAMNDTCLYIHTGGTTGTPKICVVSHRQMLWNAFELVVVGGGTMDARELITFPFFHIGGWNSITPILQGGGFAVLTRQFDPGQVLDLVEQEGIRHFGAVEAMFRMIQEHPRFATARLGSLVGLKNAGGPCAESVMRAFADRGIPITQAYGLTEAGPSNFIHAVPDADAAALWEHNRSIGTSLPYCDYRIVDQTTGKPVPRGSPGVICMRSPHNFEGYLDDPERTGLTISRDGWVWSGDLAVEDDDGYVRIVGRADNMFVSGGENVSPEEIESVLADHPRVQQAGVVAVADRRWGQVPVAAVAISGSADGALVEALHAHCREQLAGFKRPREIRVLDALPYTGAGKLDRSALRLRIAEAVDRGEV